MAQKWTRIKDKRTGHEYSVAHVNDKIHEVLDKPATKRSGKPLPPKPRMPKSSSTTTTSSANTTANKEEKK